MKTTLLLSLLVAAAVALVGAICLIGWGLATYNTQASLQNVYNMKVKDNSSEFDNMWKTISQTCQIAENKKDAFHKIFVANSEARTPEDAGKMMLWVKENSPVVDLQIFDNAQNIIVGTRNSWTMRQKELVAIATVYNDNLVRQPTGLFLGFFGFKLIDPKLITSSRTEKAFETGKDDDVSLTPKS